MKLSNSSTGKRKFHIETWRIKTIFLMLYDAMAISISYFFALWIRFDGFSEIPEKYFDPYVNFLPFYVVISLVAFYVLRMYHSVWEYVSIRELMRAAVGSISVSVIHTVVIVAFFGAMPRSYHLIGAGMQVILLLAARFSYRIISAFPQFFGTDTSDSHSYHRVMIIGAGDAGRMLLENIQKTRANKDQVVCFIDDNPDKRNRYFGGVRIVGNRDDILQSVEKYNVDRIYIAMPSASKEIIRDIVNICKESGCETKTLPDFYQFVNSGITAGALKEVSVEDLLGRDPINTDMKEVYDLINGKTILVTGGGGSIGSELCRQLSAHNPERLIIFDIYENNVYSIQQELKDKYPELKLEVLIGSVRDSRRLDYVFKKFRPDIVAQNTALIFHFTLQPRWLFTMRAVQDCCRKWAFQELFPQESSRWTKYVR